jgi:hypothetical protein
MKFIIRTQILLLTCVSFFGFTKINKEKSIMTGSKQIIQNEVKMISPSIDTTREIAGLPGIKYEKVKYVKELSPGGKAALEIAESGEYIIILII